MRHFLSRQFQSRQFLTRQLRGPQATTTTGGSAAGVLEEDLVERERPRPLGELDDEELALLVAVALAL